MPGHHFTLLIIAFLALHSSVVEAAWFNAAYNDATSEGWRLDALKQLLDTAVVCFRGASFAAGVTLLKSLFLDRKIPTRHEFLPVVLGLPLLLVGMSMFVPLSWRSSFMAAGASSLFGKGLRDTIEVLVRGFCLGSGTQMLVMHFVPTASRMRPLLAAKGLPVLEAVGEVVPEPKAGAVPAAASEYPSAVQSEVSPSTAQDLWLLSALTGLGTALLLCGVSGMLPHSWSVSWMRDMDASLKAGVETLERSYRV